VTHNNASDIGIEGGWGRQDLGGTIKNASAVNGFGLSGLSSLVGTNFNQFGPANLQFRPGLANHATRCRLYQILGTDYQVTLRAIAQAGNAKVLSRPSILARNNQPATITVGQSVPLIPACPTTALNGTPINAISYRDVGRYLEGYPLHYGDGLVEMMVSPQISSIDANLSIPISAGSQRALLLNVRAADTVAVTAYGQTVIIGGLMETDKAQTDTKSPSWAISYPR